MSALLRLLLFLLLAIALPAALLAATPAAAEAALRADGAPGLIAAVNAERARHGLAALAPEPRLACAAVVHSEAMAAERFVEHEGGRDGGLAQRLARAGYSYTLAEENVAAGMAAPEEAVAEWMASPGHRRNLLDPAVVEAGAGHAFAPQDGQGFGHYWTLILAAPLRANAAPEPGASCERE